MYFKKSFRVPIWRLSHIVDFFLGYLFPWWYPWSFWSPGPNQNVSVLIFFALLTSWPWVSVVMTRGTSRNGKNACTEDWFKELSHCHAAACNSFWNKVRVGLMEGWKEGMMVWCSCPLRCMAWGGMRLLTVCCEASPLKLNLWSLNYRCVLTSSYFVFCISQIFHL